MTRIVVVGGLAGLGALLAVTPALLLVLTAVQALRGDPDARPLALVGGAVLSGAAAWGARRLAARLGAGPG